MEPESFNPYAPPRAATEEPVENLRLDAGLASRWQRLGGAMFDSLLRLGALSPGYAGVRLARGVAVDGAGPKHQFYMFAHGGKLGVVAAVATVALLAVQWTLLVKRGQTVGKMVAGTRIVRTDDSRAGLVHVLVLRTFPLVLVEILAAVASGFAMLGTLDDLFVFRSDRRCLHDLIAGTKVVRVRAGG